MQTCGNWGPKRVWARGALQASSGGLLQCLQSCDPPAVKALLFQQARCLCPELDAAHRIRQSLPRQH